MNRYELRRIVKSPIFYLGILLMLAGLIMGAKPMLEMIEMLRSYITNPAPDLSSESAIRLLGGVSGYEIFKNSLYETASTFFAPAVPLFVGLLFSGDYAYHKNTGFGDSVITRSGFDKYYRRSLCKTFFAPFVVVVILLFFYLLVCLLIFSARSPGTPTTNFGSDFEPLYYDTPMLFSILSILHFGLYAGIYSLIGFCFSYFTSNRFLIAVSPFFVYIALLMGTQAVGAEILKWLFPDTFTYFLTNKVLAPGLPGAVNYLIILALYFVPISCIILLKYRKDRKSYIR